MAGRILPVALATIVGVSIGVATFDGEFKKQRIARMEEEYKRYADSAGSFCRFHSYSYQGTRRRRRRRRFEHRKSHSHSINCCNFPAFRTVTGEERGSCRLRAC
jgi:hypothetical protein